ncbi:MAG: phosphoribosyltransferase [Cyanobacteria bacterium SID2]|nr:phosphoribosyltransferase [Cyanobacteria bacterium SID2]MBP0004216.1 phosphoribosyltransferase [Cyanobacteria bacterium SBC]
MIGAFRDRTEAGRILASQLDRYANRHDVIVLGLPRGGVPVAFEIAYALKAPLDICLVRKLGAPNNPELAMGAIGSRGDIAINEGVMKSLQVSDEAFQSVLEREHHELHRRDRRYRGSRPPVDLRDRTVILVDDGAATGATLMAAIATLRHQHPTQIVVAIPVAAPTICEKLRQQADRLVCPLRPKIFDFLGMWYEDFSPTQDEEVCRLLDLAEQRQLAQT